MKEVVKVIINIILFYGVFFIMELIIDFEVPLWVAFPTVILLSVTFLVLSIIIWTKHGDAVHAVGDGGKE